MLININPQPPDQPGPKQTLADKIIQFDPNAACEIYRWASREGVWSTEPPWSFLARGLTLPARNDSSSALAYAQAIVDRLEGAEVKFPAMMAFAYDHLCEKLLLAGKYRDAAEAHKRAKHLDGTALAPLPRLVNDALLAIIDGSICTPIWIQGAWGGKGDPVVLFQTLRVSIAALGGELPGFPPGRDRLVLQLLNDLWEMRQSYGGDGE